MSNKQNNFFKNNFIWFIFFLEIVFFALLSGGTFVSGQNIINVCRQTAYYGIAAVGMTFVILIGGIDLSIGSIVTLVNMIAAYMMVYLGINVWVALFICLIVSILIGLLNGVMTSYIHIPPLIATYASQVAFSGIAYMITNGRPISGFSKTYPVIDLFARWSIGPVPVCAVIAALCFAAGSFILNRTSFGRYVYAIGSNENATNRSGVEVKKIKMFVYALSGLFACIAGIVLLSRSGSAQTSVGNGFEFDVITCVVLGGVSVNGGKGRISNVIAGVLIIGALTNGMILMDVSTYTQLLIKGIVLALAVGFDCFVSKNVSTK